MSSCCFRRFFLSKLHSNVLIRPINHLVNYQLIRRSSSSSPILTEKRGAILLITINRPEKRNCINRESADLLTKAFQELDTDPDVQVGILAGKGGNFCAGYDLKELASLSEYVQENGANQMEEDQKMAVEEKAPIVEKAPIEEKAPSVEKAPKQVLLKKLIRPAPMGPSHLVTKKPTIAAIDGYAVAGGLELALLCDLRVVEETAVLGVFCRRFGVPLIDGGTVRLPKIIGLGRALDLILTGRPIDGKEASAIGLATLSVQTGCCLGQAINLATSLLKFDQECLQADRDSVYNSLFNAQSQQEALHFEFERGRRVIMSASVRGANLFVKQGLGKHGKFGFDPLEDLMKIGTKGRSKLLDE